MHDLVLEFQQSEKGCCIVGNSDTDWAERMMIATLLLVTCFSLQEDQLVG